jgi:hypothetical protein
MLMTKERNKKGQFVKGGEPWNIGKTGIAIGTRKGTKFSDEHRRNLSLAHKGQKAWNKGIGKTHICERCLNQFYKVGHTRNYRYCSNKCQGLAMRGSNHFAWRGGIAGDREKAMHRREYKLWRKAVYERDKFTCMNCGQRGGRLNADHIKPWALYPDLRYSIKNGKTLCIDCHRQTSTYGGRTRVK